MIRFRRKWRHLPPPRQPSMEGEKARKRAEGALSEVRARAERQRALRDWFRAQYEKNGWGGDVDTVWGGKS